MGTNLASVAEQELTAQQWFERCFNSKDRDEKLRFYSNALRLQPDFAEAFATEASRKAKGDLDGALADYDEAIRLKPDLAEAFHNRGDTRRPKASWMAPSQTTTRQSASSRTTAMPSTTAAQRVMTRLTWTAPSQTST